MITDEYVWRTAADPTELATKINEVAKHGYELVSVCQWGSVLLAFLKTVESKKSAADVGRQALAELQEMARSS